jgi:hypothetical protein
MPRPVPESPQPSTSELATVRSALNSFGVRIDEAELAVIAAGWEQTRAAVDRLYDPPEVRYADPALRFQAVPPGA